jgi:hypothetical protein
MVNACRTLYIAVLTLGFALVVAGGLCAFYVVPALEPRLRAPGGLLSIAAVFAGLLLIINCGRRLEASSDEAEEPHVPGLDLDVETKPTRPVSP